MPPINPDLKEASSCQQHYLHWRTKWHFDNSLQKGSDQGGLWLSQRQISPVSRIITGREITPQRVASPKHVNKKLIEDAKRQKGQLLVELKMVGAPDTSFSNKHSELTNLKGGFMAW